MEGSREAFAAVTERYAGLVYSAAWRRTGSRELAEEVAQNVFSILARKAPRLLQENAPLSAWLHRAAVLEAAQASRREQARQRVMKAYLTNHETTSLPEHPAASAFDELLPDLDEGLNRLPHPDRELLLGRYFEDRSYRELAAVTGRSEAALMQQHHRALEKLARFFQHRGHAVSAIALASGLSAPLTQAAPAGLAGSWAAAAAAGTSTAAGFGAAGVSAFQLAFAMQIKTHLLTVAAVLCLATGTAAFFAGQARSRNDGTPQNPTAGPLSGTGGKSSASRPSGGTDTSADPSALLAALPVPTAGEVLAADGRERVEKLALWLTGAQPDALGDMLDKLSALEETDSQRTEKELILQRWVELDPKKALAACRKIEGYTWYACEAWGRLDPKAAWAAAAKMDYFEKTHVATSIAESDPVMAREILANSPGLDNMVKNRLRDAVAQNLARKDPRLGWEFALKSGTRIREQSTLTEWIGKAPDEAVSFALSLPVLQRMGAMPTLLSGLNQYSPDKIGPLLDSLPEGRLKWKSASAHASELARTDADAAASLAEDPSASPATRAAVTQSLAEMWADSRPDQVLNLLRQLDWKLTADTDTGPEILTSTGPSVQAGESRAAAALQKLAANGHLSETLEITNGIPPGAQRDQALTAVVNGWPSAQVMELSEWLITQESPSVRTTGARKIVDHLMADSEPDFEAAASWAATLPVKGDPADSLIVGVMRKWREKDPDAAKATLQTLQLPDNLLAAIDQTPAK